MKKWNPIEGMDKLSNARLKLECCQEPYKAIVKSTLSSRKKQMP
jgi:hypothetical protein